MKKYIFCLFFVSLIGVSFGQTITKTMLKLPDTGQNGDYTQTFGEDSDYSINTPFYIKNNNGTVTDTITGLMWQQADGGEMTYENALKYADTLTLGGFTDWRLPTAHESFSILNHQKLNPALDITVFAATGAEYWWTSDKQANDATKIWVTNAGGGIGNHSKTETISAGGTKKFHARVVRNMTTPTTVTSQFTDLGSGVVKDNLTGLIWQKTPLNDTLTWENALTYAEGLTLGGFSDWRLPNIKELQSLNDERIVPPSVSTTFFPTIGVKKYWSSTTLPNQITRAWYLNTQFGITTYDLKTVRLAVICVRGNSTNTTQINENTNSVRPIKLFPNPTSGNQIQFEIDELNKDFTAQLIDIQGQIILNQIFIRNTFDKIIVINTPNLLRNGVYCLKIIQARKTSLSKVIINK